MKGLAVNRVVVLVNMKHIIFLLKPSQKRIAALFAASLLISCFTNTLFAATSGFDLENIPLPKRTFITVVTDGIELNKVGMSVWKANFPKSVEQVLQFYRDQWQQPVVQNAPGFVESNLGEWQVISRLDGDYLITVQVKSKGKKRSEGMLAISDLPTLKAAPRLGKHFPKPSKTQVHNDIESTDGDVFSRTLIMESAHPLKTVARFYDSYYQQKGWQRQGLINEGAVYRNKNKIVNLAMIRERGKTRIVVVETTDG